MNYIRYVSTDSLSNNVQSRVNGHLSTAHARNVAC